MPKPALVLLPGLLCDARLFARIIPTLEKTYTIHVPDLTVADSMEGLATHVLDSVEGPFTLAGLSMGGYVAQKLMTMAPERVTRLVLMATSARQDTPAMQKHRQAMMRAARSPLFRGMTPNLLKQFVHADALRDKDLCDTVIAMARDMGAEKFLTQMQAIVGREDMRDSLKNIRVPTTILVGDSDTRTPPERAREIEGLIPGSTLHIIPHCGHLPPLEKPDEVLAHFPVAGHS